MVARPTGPTNKEDGEFMPKPNISTCLACRRTRNVSRFKAPHKVLLVNFEIAFSLLP